MEAVHTCEVVVPATADEVYATLATAAGLSRWWQAPVGGDVAVGASLSLPVEAGALVVRVDRLERPSLVSWTCLGGVPEWVQSTIRFDVMPRQGATTVRLTHSGWRRRDGGDAPLSWPRLLLGLARAVSRSGRRRGARPRA
jgi:uncharacterized protein YndB with AHSA1/START domain